MLPFSNVVNHMPLSERNDTTPCEQETHSTLVLTSTYPLLRTYGAVSCPTTNLCQDCFRRREKNRNQCDLSAKTIRKTLIKSRLILKPQLHIRTADSLDTCTLMSFKEFIVSGVLERLEWLDWFLNPAQAFIVLINPFFPIIFIYSVSFQKNACCLFAHYIAQTFIWLFVKDMLVLLFFQISYKARQ